MDSESGMTTNYCVKTTEPYKTCLHPHRRRSHQPLEDEAMKMFRV